MNRILNTVLILAVILASFVFSLDTSAQVYFSNIEVFDLENGRVKISWHTATATKARIFLGESAGNLDRLHPYESYDVSHIITFTNIQKDLTYYFKIVAIDRNGRRVESFLQTFSTVNMKDTRAPEVISVRIVQTTGDAALISWTTNEETNAEIHYGFKAYDLKWRAGYGSLTREHGLYIYNLGPEQIYYAKIFAKDKSGNKSSRGFTFRTGRSIDRNTALKIYNIKPTSFEPELIGPRKVTLQWRINLAAKSFVVYGTVTDNHPIKLEASNNRHDVEHSLTIDGLEPNTTYYYKIHAYDSFYGKRLWSKELTFTTSLKEIIQPKVLGTQTTSQFVDSDGDRLSDGFEYSIGTDPFKYDSDGDGYNDGSEFNHGWDPNIAGSTQETRLQAFRYYMPKRDYNYRVQQDGELSLYVRSQLGSVSVSPENWRKLSDAYIYGGYPAQTIVQAIRHGGKTVHPSIHWNAWKNSPQYLEYMNK